MFFKHALVINISVKRCFGKGNLKKKKRRLYYIYYIEVFRRHTTPIPCIHCKNNVRRGFYREGLY